MKPQRVTHIELLVQQGFFHGVDWHYVVDLKTGIRYRLDGQHSSKMLSEMPPEKIPPWRGRVARALRLPSRGFSLSARVMKC